MSRRHYVNDAAVVQITGSITNSQTTITVSDASSFPTQFPWTAVIDAGLPAAEIVLVTAAAANVLTVTRGYDGTSGQAHAANAAFAHVAVKADYDEANSHINLSAGVHGLAGSVVGTTDTQTLSGKTLISPTITAPTVTGGASVAGAFTATGAVTQTGANDTTVGQDAIVARDVTAGRDVVAVRAVLSPGWITQAHYAQGQSLPAGTTTTLGSVASPATADFDTLGALTTTTGAITIPAGMGGRYELSGQVFTASTGSAILVNAYIFLNGSAILTAIPLRGGAQTQDGCVFPIMDRTLAAGDVLAMKVLNSTASASVGGSGGDVTYKSFFRVKRVS